MPPIQLIVFDCESMDLRMRRRFVEQELAQAPDHEFEPLYAGTRTECLDLAAAASDAVALVDLRAVGADLRGEGFETIETIRRHPRLRERCRPAAWTAHRSWEWRDHAERLGAYGMLDMEQIVAGTESILSFVREVAALPLRPFGEPVAFVGRDERAATPEEEERRRRGVFPPRPWTPEEREILKLMADGHDSPSTVSQILGLKPELVRERMTAFRKAVGGSSVSSSRRNQEILRAMLSRPPMEPAPPNRVDVEDSQDVVNWAAEPKTRRAAWLTPEEEQGLEAYRKAEPAIRMRFQERTAGPGRKSSEDVEARERELDRVVAAKMAIDEDGARRLIARFTRKLRAAADDRGIAIGEVD